MFNWYFRQKFEIHEFFNTNWVYYLLYIVYLYLKFFLWNKLIRYISSANTNINTWSYATNTPSSLLLHLFINWRISYYFYFRYRILVKELKLHTINNKWNILYSISCFNYISWYKYLRSRVICIGYQLIIFLYTKRIYQYTL